MPRFPITVDGYFFTDYDHFVDTIADLLSDLDSGELSHHQRNLTLDRLDQLRYILATE